MTLSATSSKYILYVGNTQAIQISGLIDNLTQTYLNAATITGTLVDDQGNVVPECDDVVFNYQAGSNGNYIGIFGDEGFTPAVGTGYTLIIDGNQSGSFIHLELLVEIQARQN